MTPARAIFLTWLSLMTASQRDQIAGPRYGEWTGTVETGIMAIGGETTGMRLVTSAGPLELSATDAVLARLRQLNGVQATLLGSLQTRSGIEVRTRSIIVVTQVRRPTPSVSRTTASPLYLAFLSGQDRSEWTTKRDALPPAAQLEFNRRIARRRTLQPSSAKGREEGVERARLELRAALVAYAGPSATAEAAEYAKGAKLYYEWEGYADAPLAEAAVAEKYLLSHPRSTLQPYLQLFQLHRLRAAFECAGRAAGLPDTTAGPVAMSEQLQRDAAAKYRALLARVNASADALTRALAADIDAVTFIYFDIGAHP